MSTTQQPVTCDAMRYAVQFVATMDEGKSTDRHFHIQVCAVEMTIRPRGAIL